MTQEFISLEAGERDAWICLCGNKPHYAGFYPCDAVGNEIEPAAGWNGLYVCDECGRIIRQDSLEIIGRKSGALIRPTSKIPKQNTGFFKNGRCFYF